jgi:hypothetical protein
MLVIMRWWALVLVACHTTTPLDRAHLAAAFVDAECHYLTKCGEFPDEASCHLAYTGLNFTVDADGLAIDQHLALYDPIKARICVDATANASCDRTDASTRVSPEACDTVIRGTMGNGASCALNSECISQNCSIPICVVTCCRGSCVGDTAPARAPVGASCTGVACAAGAFCDLASRTCTKLFAAGQSCAAGYQCAYGLGCTGTPLTCAALPKVGQACPDMQCRDNGATCGADGVCHALGLPGAACATRADCSPYYICDSTGHCAESSTLGGPCMTSGDCFDQTFCAIPTGQTAGVCAMPQADGSTCTQDRDCTSFHCEETIGMCTTPAVCS